MLSDFELLERRIQRSQKAAKGDKTLAAELELLQAAMAVLEKGKSVRTLELTEEQNEIVKSFNLLSSKPIIYVANVSEEDLADDGNSNPHVAKVREFAVAEDAEVIVVCAQIEEEISQLQLMKEKNSLMT